MTQEDRIAKLERRVERERTARKQAEQLLTQKSVELYESLQESKSAQNRLEMALWASQEAYWEWRAETDTFEVRAFALHTKKEIQWRSSALRLMRRIHPDDLANLQFHWTMATHNGRESLELAFRFRFPKGYQWMRMRGRVLSVSAEGVATHVVGTSKDVTRQQEAEHSFQLMATAFASSREPMLVLNTGMVISECNAAFIQLLGAARREDCIGLSLYDLLPEAQAQIELMAKQQQQRFETHLTNKSGLALPVDVSIALFETQAHSSSYLIATIRDVSERKLNERRLTQLALYDELTGLKNRSALREELQMWEQAHQEFLVMFIDLDGFKQINDAGGHEQGDKCLKLIADKLPEVFPEDAILTRWGGDEFVVAMRNTSIEDGVRLGNQMIQMIEADKHWGASTELMLSASIGLAAFPNHGDSSEFLIHDADAAMYQAKANGKGQVYVYQQGLLESMKQRVTMLADLRRSINNHSLEFHLQGKYTVQGALTGAELLCRWHSNIHGQVPPNVFIPLAEANQLDSEIGLLALESACDYITMFESFGLVVPMAVNISANQVLDPGFLNQAVSICEANMVDPSLIEIELTESIFIKDARSAVKCMRDLQTAGFKLSLDDFGSGFSSLSYLRSFSFNAVKIDRSLIDGIHVDAKALALLEGLVSMLKLLQMWVVIEGIENAEQLSIIANMDVDAIQGYYFSKPKPYDSFISKHSRSEL